MFIVKKFKILICFVYLFDENILIFYFFFFRRWEKFNWLSFWNGLLFLGKEEFFLVEKGMIFLIVVVVCGVYVVCVCVCGGDGGYKVLEMWVIRMEGVVE